jgi:hypothetical protein
MLDNYVCNMGDKGITGIKRRRESLRRLIISRACLKMKNVADEEDAEEVMKFYNVMLLHEQQAIAVSKRPEIETRDVCISILKKMKSFGGYAVKELMDAARKESEQVLQYVGSDSIDRLDPEHNRKVRKVVQLLEQHSNIKRAGDRPIKLLWIDNDNTPKPDDGIPPADIHPTDDTPSIDSQPTNPKPSDISDVTDTTKSTEPIEDYEAYVDRQKMVFDAIKLETQAQKTPMELNMSLVIELLPEKRIPL